MPRFLRRARHALANRLASLIAAPAGWGLRLSGKPLGLVLGYHGIGDPPGDPDRDLVPVLGSATFECHMNHLRRHYRPVPASRLLEAARARRRGQRFPVAVTFDDDLASHARVAMPILRRAGVPATFFVCGASLNAPFSFWWERLQRAVDAGSFTAADRERLAGRADASIQEVASAIQGLPPDERDEVARRLGEVAGPDPPDAGLRRQELRALVDGGCDVGFHTLRHDDLRLLDDHRLEAALEDGRAAVASATGTRIELIAYPHGSADGRVAAAASAHGYRFGFTMDAEPVTTATEPLGIGRLEPGGGRTSRFALDLVRVLRRG